MSSALVGGVAQANDNASGKGEMLADAKQYLAKIAGDKGIGPREAATASETETANYIYDVLLSFGYQVERQEFTVSFKKGAEKKTSQNIIAYKPGRSGKSLVLGAHYDSINAKAGSHGVIDNGASVAVMLSLAKHLSTQPKSEDGIVFIAFGAEEVGLRGSRHFVNKLTTEEQQSFVGMINMDTIVGGDKLYIHSAHNKPYNCQGVPNNYRFDTSLRDELLKVSKEVFGDDGYQLHPDYAGYPAGETGNWSDHAPFACAGMPVAYLEATNFSIVGKDGNDGYSQSIHPKLWSCINEEKLSACDAKSEKKWGQIWHTGADQLNFLNGLFPERINQQMDKSLQLLSAYFE